MVVEFARGYAVSRIASSFWGPYERGWKICIGWRSSVRKWHSLEKEVTELEVVEDATAFMAYC